MIDKSDHIVARSATCPTLEKDGFANGIGGRISVRIIEWTAGCGCVLHSARVRERRLWCKGAAQPAWKNQDFGSPEESYHFRFYQLVADKLPITPISYHPPADNTTLRPGGLSARRAAYSAAAPARRRHCCAPRCTPLCRFLPVFSPLSFLGLSIPDAAW